MLSLVTKLGSHARRSTTATTTAALLGWAIGGCAHPAAVPRCAETPAPTARYVDADGNTLERYDDLWRQLARFYGATQPGAIAVHFAPGGPSRFDAAQATVTLSLGALRGRSLRPVLAHESSHLFLAALTGGASTLEGFRFVDEGVASLLEHQVAADEAVWKVQALGGTAERLRAAPFGLAELQRWSAFFGDGGERSDYGAYDVGASFVLFVRAEHGDARLVELLRAIGATRSLDAASRQALGRPLAELEAAWLAYLRRVDLGAAGPVHVLELRPANDEHGAPTDLREITVTFDADMAPSLCLSTPCQEGVCHDHARWKTPRTLAIGVDHPLLPHHAYRLALGWQSCRLKSLAGGELPLTEWRFETR